jgi:beta-lactamase regulating signal transducer with metallopeptidase domain/beta-lactamase class D
MIENILINSPVQTVGWGLLHSLWQGALIASLLRFLLIAMQRSSANARYLAALAALFLMLAAPILTAWRTGGTSILLPGNAITSSTDVNQTEEQLPQDAASIWGADRATSGNLQTRQLDTPSYMKRLELWANKTLPSVLPWFVLLWIGGVTLHAARLFGGWLAVLSLKRKYVITASQEWQQVLARLAGAVGVNRTVVLLQSAVVEVPTVIGWLRPVILVPAGAMMGFNPRQLEALLAHELAHVRRFDYLVNLFQSIAETLLFYHPLAWWVSKTIRAEREQACDDLAVAATGDALGYARALVEAEVLRCGAAPARSAELAMAVTGGSLSQRIRRLVAAPDRTYPSPSMALAALAVLMMLFIYAGARAVMSRQFGGPEGAMAVPVDKAETGLKKENGEGALSGEVSEQADDNTDREDAEIRRAAVEALGDRAGTVIVMNPQTGQLYTVVNQNWALRRNWNPASTMKLITALAALDDKVANPDEQVRVSAKGPQLNLNEALAISNNNYFKNLSMKVGKERFLRYARQFGIGDTTGSPFAGESAGYLPDDRDDVDAGRLGAYGDRTLVTPMQLAVFISTIANGGDVVIPHLGADSPRETRHHLNLSPEALQRVIAGMVSAVDHGTGSPAKDAAISVAGKTGTVDGKETATGLFLSFAPANEPRIVVVVGIQGKDASGSRAAGVAGKIYRALGNRI